MDEDEIRRRQIKKAIRVRYGTQSAFAEAVGTPDSYVSRILSGKPSAEGGKRLTGDLARKWEKKADLPRYYFDDPDIEVPDAEGGEESSLRDELAAVKDELRALREAMNAPNPADTGRWRLGKDVNSGRDRKKKDK